jgi:hypothetical protein
MRRTIGRIVAVATLLAVALVAAVTTGVGSTAAEAQAAGPRGEFTAVEPERILDTRSGLGQPQLGPIVGGGTIDLQVAGRGGVPVSGASAVVMNVTAVSPTADGYLTVYPTGTRPTISNLNFTAGAVVPNMVTVALGADGGLQIFNPVGSTHVLADVVGFYADATGPSGSRYTAIPSYRRFDTRNALGEVLLGPMWPLESVNVQVNGRGGVPATGVTAIVMNVTVTAPTAAGYLRVRPFDSDAQTSSVNFVPGQTVPNLITIPVPPNGVIEFFNAAGYTHVIADIVGYYGPAVSEAGRFIPVTPVRSLDSRRLAPGGAPIPPDYVAAAYLGWHDGVPADVVESAVLNVTVTQPTAAGFLTVFDDDLCEIPLASSLNFRAGQTVANQVVTGLSSPYTPGSCALAGAWPAAAFYNPVGSTHFIVDTFGYFTDAEGFVSATTPGWERSLTRSADASGPAPMSEPAREPMVVAPAGSRTRD